MHRAHCRLITLWFCVSLCSFVATPALAFVPQSLSMARHRALGSSVSVIGSVTVPTGAFDAGFAIQGFVDGIYVLDAADHIQRALGDVVLVTGTLVDSFGLLAIQPTSVACLFHGPTAPAHPHATGTVGEATEGRLLRLHGTMVGPLVDDSPYGYKLAIDDGSGPVQVFLYPGSGISTAGLVDGVQIETSCFSNQYETT
ncbi:MAG TPA: hypothetical protein VIV60_04160, partial [Polyangiaceae bacterium]